MLPIELRKDFSLPWVFSCICHDTFTYTLLTLSAEGNPLEADVWFSCLREAKSDSLIAEASSVLCSGA